MQKSRPKPTRAAKIASMLQRDQPVTARQLTEALRPIGKLTEHVKTLAGHFERLLREKETLQRRVAAQEGAGAAICATATQVTLHRCASCGHSYTSEVMALMCSKADAAMQRGG